MLIVHVHILPKSKPEHGNIRISNLQCAKEATKFRPQASTSAKPVTPRSLSVSAAPVRLLSLLRQELLHEARDGSNLGDLIACATEWF